MKLFLTSKNLLLVALIRFSLANYTHGRGFPLKNCAIKNIRQIWTLDGFFSFGIFWKILYLLYILAMLHKFQEDFDNSWYYLSNRITVNSWENNLKSATCPLWFISVTAENINVSGHPMVIHFFCRGTPPIFFKKILCVLSVGWITLWKFKFFWISGWAWILLPSFRFLRNLH